VKRNCIICGAEFEGKGKATICSNKECRKEYNRKRQHDYAVKIGKFILNHKTCVICGGNFDTYNTRQICCSKGCAKINSFNTTAKNNIKNKDINNKRRRDKYISQKGIFSKDKPCAICGKISKNTTCSEKCKKEKIRLYINKYRRDKRNEAKEK
jgi:predicted nucleic acid-binding Zn ribbon protein